MDPITHDSDKALSIHGVPGRLTHRTTKPGERAGCWTRQRWISEVRPIAGYGDGAKIRAELRFDDVCGNGHNTFAITAEVWRPRRRDMEAGGCMHDEISEHFPELAHLIPWHLCSTDGPMHYAANTVYLAGDRDHNGKRAGEPWAFDEVIQFGDNPIKHKIGRAFWQFLKDSAPHPGRGAYDFEVLEHPHPDHGKPGKHQFSPKYTFGGFAERWHECPFDTEAEALDFLAALQNCRPQFLQVPTLYSEGKARELDAARRTAIWPEATDEQLSAEPDELRADLIARLPDLIARFRGAMEAAGFAWSPETLEA